MRIKPKQLHLNRCQASRKSISLRTFDVENEVPAIKTTSMRVQNSHQNLKQFTDVRKHGRKIIQLTNYYSFIQRSLSNRKSMSLHNIVTKMFAKHDFLKLLKVNVSAHADFLQE